MPKSGKGIDRKTSARREDVLDCQTLIKTSNAPHIRKVVCDKIRWKKKKGNDGDDVNVSE